MRSIFLQVADRLNDKQTRWFIFWLAKWAMLILAVVLYTIVIARVSDAKAERRYERWKTEWAEARIAEQEEAARAALESDPYQIQLNEEAEVLARVLYGVRENSTDDLKTYCWCVFNRVDNSNYPDTITDVIAQPGQWMRYDRTNPVLSNLYDIAREQLDLWHTDAHRPVDSSYVFMNWSSRDIVLRDQWAEGSGTHYWRFGQ